MRRGSLIATVLILAVGFAALWWIKTPVSAPEGQRPQATRRGSRGNNSDSVPVTIAVAREQAVPVTREGIGTVQPLNTVLVRSQVDGRLLSVEFQEGQMVKRGDLLARIDPVTYQAQLDQAIAKKAQDEATLANAKVDLARYRKLAESNAAPKQQADQQAALVAQLEAQVKSDDAAISNTQAVLGYTTIVSPLDGRTGFRNVDPGNIVKAADATGIVSITQLKPISVVFTLPQRDLAAVNAALTKGTAPVDVLDSDGQSVLAHGELQTIDNQVDVSTGTIKLKAVFPNDDLKLWPGQFVTARITVETIAGALVVPAEAVRRGPNGNFAYVVDADQVAHMKPIDVSLQDARLAVVRTGLKAGDQVVTLGFGQLADGKTVAVTTAADPTAALPGSSPAPKQRRGERGQGRDGSQSGEPGKERRRRPADATGGKSG